jgi:hypothetical protein
MKYYKSDKGYFYKVKNNGDKIRISQDMYNKNIKVGGETSGQITLADIYMKSRGEQSANINLSECSNVSNTSNKSILFHLACKLLKRFHVMTKIPGFYNFNQDTFLLAISLIHSTIDSPSNLLNSIIIEVNDENPGYLKIKKVNEIVNNSRILKGSSISFLMEENIDLKKTLYKKDKHIKIIEGIINIVNELIPDAPPKAMRLLGFGAPPNA